MRERWRIRVIAPVLSEDNWIALRSWTPARLIRATLCGQQNRRDIASLFGGRADRSQMTADLARPTKPTSGSSPRSSIGANAKAAGRTYTLYAVHDRGDERGLIHLFGV